MKLKKTLIALSVSAGLALSSQVNAGFVDVVTIVDESGSMSGEHAWLGGMINTLDTALGNLNPAISPNNYGLVGFGGSSTHRPGHQHDVGGAGSQFGSASQFNTAVSTLVLNGGFEDGYSGINTANGYAFRPGAARNYILVTDEDRDNGNSSLNYSGMLSSMTSTKTLLNAVVNASFVCGDGSSALGIDSHGNGYQVDGSGGFTTCSGASATSGFGTTIADYVNLALATGGAAWNLNVLRSGGTNADSFTKAFIDIKVREITNQTGNVPEPTTLALLGLGWMGFRLRRKTA